MARPKESPEKGSPEEQAPSTNGQSEKPDDSKPEDPQDTGISSLSSEVKFYPGIYPMAVEDIRPLPSTQDMIDSGIVPAIEISRPCDAIIKALFEVQKQMDLVERSRKGQEGNRTYEYSPLDAIWRQLKKACDQAGVLVTHHTFQGTLRTVGWHAETAQWAATSLKLSAHDNPKRAAGNMTYWKRYNTQNLFNITPEGEDDDKNVSDNRQQNGQGRQQGHQAQGQSQGGNAPPGGSQAPTGDKGQEANPDSLTLMVAATGEVITFKRTKNGLQDWCNKLEELCEDPDRGGSDNWQCNFSVVEHAVMEHPQFPCKFHPVSGDVIETLSTWAKKMNAEHSDTLAR